MLASSGELGDEEHGDVHKDAQAAHFHHGHDEAFEVTRPHGTPELYRFFLREKFRRAVGPILPHLRGASVLTVCGGSGMDAEFFARNGATVTTSDISLGAARRALARAERYGVDFESIVADAEHLPYADASVDVVSVHDGLHHLADPYAGLAEMARVARHWVVISEPAQATVTRIAIRLGLALEREEAGNRVARLDPAEAAGFLEDRGFAIVKATRYAMYYPHHPGRAFALLSRPFLYPLARSVWKFANGLLGHRIGNKMVVVAERHAVMRHGASGHGSL